MGVPSSRGGLKYGDVYVTFMLVIVKMFIEDPFEGLCGCNEELLLLLIFVGSYFVLVAKCLVGLDWFVPLIFCTGWRPFVTMVVM